MEIDTPHGIMIFLGGRLAHANLRAAQMAGCSLEEMRVFTQEDLFSLARPADQERLRDIWQVVLAGDLAPPALNVCVQPKDGNCHWADVLVSRVIFQGQAAIQVNWIDTSPRSDIEESLHQHIRRMQTLHDIDHAISSSLEEGVAARAALRHIPYLMPDYRASSVILIDQATDQVDVLAYDFRDTAPQEIFGQSLSPDDLAVDLEALRDGLPFVVHDLESLLDLRPMQEKMVALGVRAYLSVPLRWAGSLIGVLNLASGVPHAFEVEQVQIAQDVADSLAVAIQQARLRKTDAQRRREAEVMRDVMVALASAGDLKQTLESLLINLRNIIHYDRAGLILVDEEDHYILAGDGLPADRAPHTYLEFDPVVVELRRTRQPIVVPDAQLDTRLAKWPDLGSVRGWMGAPLMAGEEMIGFLTLGSLKVDAYGQADAELMQSFAAQVADVLARAWRYEQSHRRTEELEVLSSISFALGRAERGENTLLAVVEQIARFFGAGRGTFLFPGRGGTSLVIRASLDESIIGQSFPRKEDIFWRALTTGETQVIPDLGSLPRDAQAKIYTAIFLPTGSAVVIPLKADEAIFGLLCLAFSKRRGVSQENLRLYDAVAEIAAASVHRAVVLEALERQIKVRTQHLATLYSINAVASEPLDLAAVLQQVLDITLQAMKSRVGMIHFLSGDVLALAVQRNVSGPALAGVERLSLEADFWRDIARSASPLVEPALAAGKGIPEEMVTVGGRDFPAYIGAPIRAKGRWLGLLSVFEETVLEHSAEDITLFMTIADQIGGLVERARLMEQAELAAVVEERQRLARELHDSVTQLLYSQVLFSGASLKVLRQGNLELAEGHLARIDQAALQALKEMRLLVYQLRPSDTLDEGLVSALERRLESVERRTGIDARFELEGDLDLDEGVEMALFRIAEEALNNTLKHAGARHVRVAIRVADGRLRLEIGDDGCGFDWDEKIGGGGMGLSNMRERAAALGGELQVISQPGQGTRVILELEVSE